MKWNKKPKKPKKPKKKMAISFTPFEELFAHEYQSTYINSNGNIHVGPYTYSVFYGYTVAERQAAFQVCKKHLPWEFSEEQEQWELCMYMYQFIIKSPPPFPYLEYTLSEDIIMAITWEITIQPLDVPRKEASIMAVRTDDTDPENILTETHFIITAILDTVAQKTAALDNIWQQHLDYQTRQTAINEYVGGLKAQAKTNLEGRE